MAISDPITENPVITKYRQFVTDKINSAIVFGDDNVPDASVASYFHGTRSGVTTNPDLIDGPITASNIFAVLLKDVNKYTRIRKFNAKRTVTGIPGGNTPIPTRNSASTANAADEKNFACEWQSALDDEIAMRSFRGNTPTFGNHISAFFAKYNTYGLGGKPTTKQEAIDLQPAAQSACVAATQKYGVSLRSGAKINTPLNVSGVGILTAKHSFFIDSSDVDHSMIVAGDLIDDADMESLFNNLYQAWKSVALDGSVTGYSESVCHSNCHSNCHSSRNRR